MWNSHVLPCAKNMYPIFCKHLGLKYVIKIQLDEFQCATYINKGSIEKDTKYYTNDLLFLDFTFENVS